MVSLKKTPAHSLRVLARLLGYPDAALRALLPELATALHAEGALSARRLQGLDALIRHLGQADSLDVETDYVELFDRGRATSLSLFEHVHGDSRDRGPAMIDLMQTYAAAGLQLAEGELPDYLPAVLEYASTQPREAAVEFLGEIAHILNALHSALNERDNPYAAAIAATLELAGETPQAVTLQAEEPVDDSWAEPEPFDGCSVKGQAAQGQAQPIHIVRNKTVTPPGAAA